MVSKIIQAVLVVAVAAILYYYLAPPLILSPPPPNSKRIIRYKFEDPRLANQILKHLDILEPLDDDSSSALLKPGKNYDRPMLGIPKDEKYCDKHRAHFTKKPQLFFEDMNLLSEWVHTSLMRSKVQQVIGNDVHPYITETMSDAQKASNEYPLEPVLTSYYTIYGLHYYHYFGKTFGCISQMYNHIPGQNSLNRKDKVSEYITQYAENYRTRPQCFTFDQFFPQTWVLSNETQCLDFFNILKSSNYQDMKRERRIVFIRKVGTDVHKAIGVQPVNEEEEEALRSIYENGALCGKELSRPTNFIVQKFIHNPLLIEGHKFDFRSYMMVASTNPLILYYHDGFLRVSLSKYDVYSNDKNVLLTNTALNSDIFEQADQGVLYNGMNATELKEFHLWTLPELEKYLLKKQLVTDQNWLENQLRPQFKKAMIHLIRATQKPFLKWSSIYEIFGVDFMLDENLVLWFLECNTSPNFVGSNEKVEKLLVKMLKDHYEIVYGILRSRLLRILNFVNQVTQDIKSSKSLPENYLNSKFDSLRAQFKQITRNYYEPGFAPSPSNGFDLIIDENLNGTEIYKGYLPQECL